MEIVYETDAAFKKIFSEMDEITKNMVSVSETDEMALESKEKILSAVELISAVTEENAAYVEEVSSTTEDQIASADLLAGLVRELNTTEINPNNDI